MAFHVRGNLFDNRLRVRFLFERILPRVVNREAGVLTQKSKQSQLLRTLLLCEQVDL